MANSRFEYVKEFECDPALLRDCWAVVRIDGQSFHKFTADHDFHKPNDERGLQLMNRCAQEVFTKFADVVFAIGMSDEYSFVLRRDAKLFDRRSQKVNSTIVSLFAASYVFHWRTFFAETPLQYVPSFDSRVVLYPTDRALRDYLSWRQADCHINNLYNTCFWLLVLRAGKSQRDAERIMNESTRNSADKNEMLFSQFGINYSHEKPMFRKGSVLVRYAKTETHCAPDGQTFTRPRLVVELLHEDIIQDDFWRRYPVIPVAPSLPVATAAKMASSTAAPSVEACDVASVAAVAVAGDSCAESSCESHSLGAAADGQQ